MFSQNDLINQLHSKIDSFIQTLDTIINEEPDISENHRSIIPPYLANQMLKRYRITRDKLQKEYDNIIELRKKPISFTLIKALLTYHLQPVDFLVSVIKLNNYTEDLKSFIDDMIKNIWMKESLTKWFSDITISLSLYTYQIYEFLKFYHHHIDLEYKQNGYTLLENLLRWKGAYFEDYIRNHKIDFSKHSQLLLSSLDRCDFTLTEYLIKQGAPVTNDFLKALDVPHWFHERIKPLLIFQKSSPGFFKNELSGSSQPSSQNQRTLSNN